MEREPGGLSGATVERRVGQLMISGPTTASDVPVPLCDKEATEHEAAINMSVLGNLAIFASRWQPCPENGKDIHLRARQPPESILPIGRGRVFATSAAEEVGDARREAAFPSSPPGPAARPNPSRAPARAARVRALTPPPDRWVPRARPGVVPFLPPGRPLSLSREP
uniref:Uncharacterized protein n=1 Tax=Oryza sativa subsp. japonica TaxID=39947 RepID=Q5VQB8_ORYSJ|nr:hypothetical protein [Oryza sativa Japonica Group]